MTKAVSEVSVHASSSVVSVNTLPGINDNRDLVFKTSTGISLEKLQNPTLYTSESYFRKVGLGYFLQLLSVALPLWFGDAMACVFSVATGLAIAENYTSPPNHFVTFVSFCLRPFHFALV